MIRSLTALAIFAIPLTGFAGMAQAEDDIVRLPGTGEVKSAADREHLKADRLKPGGGLLASFDPVAIDQAVLDLVRRRAGRSLEAMSYPGHDAAVQVRYAESLGLGSSRYDLVEV